MKVNFPLECPICDKGMTATVSKDGRLIEVTSYDHACVPRDVMEEVIEEYFWNTRPDLESD